MKVRKDLLESTMNCVGGWIQKSTGRVLDKYFSRDCDGRVVEMAFFLDKAKESLKFEYILRKDITDDEFLEIPRLMYFYICHQFIVTHEAILGTKLDRYGLRDCLSKEYPMFIISQQDKEIEERDDEMFSRMWQMIEEDLDIQLMYDEYELTKLHAIAQKWSEEHGVELVDYHPLCKVSIFDLIEKMQKKTEE